MALIRYLLAALLLLFSGQSLALFMPDGFQLNTDVADVSTDGDC